MTETTTPNQPTPVGTPATKKKVFFVSLGCAKNQVDTEVMLGVVNEGGHEVVDDPADADTLVVNTCGFIDAAKQESIDTILELGGIKAERADRQLVVAGCLSQRYPEELAAEMPEVDYFLGSADMLGLRKVLSGEAARMGVSALSRRAYLYDHAAPRQTIGARHSSFVKIAEGCDRPCAFCIIPKLRGPQRSRGVFDIVEEVHALVERGTKEVCLVAQDLTKYGDDMEERGQAPANLEGLLDALGEIAGLEWIRLHYAYPSACTDGLLDRIANHPKVATYLDVPIQHIDTEVLKKMRRGYTEKSVRNLVSRLRGFSPPSSPGQRIWLRTTMLVGHPGESEDAYRRLYDFIDEGQVDHLGVFPWSKEEGTASALLPLRVKPDQADERAAELMQLQAQKRLDRHRTMLGDTLRVLVEGPNEEAEFLLDARHEGQSPDVDGKVILCDGTASPGDMVEVKVIQAGEHDLVATFDFDRDIEDDDD